MEVISKIEKKAERSVHHENSFTLPPVGHWPSGFLPRSLSPIRLCFRIIPGIRLEESLPMILGKGPDRRDRSAGISVQRGQAFCPSSQREE
jgi:hypothetical protein